MKYRIFPLLLFCLAVYPAFLLGQGDFSALEQELENAKGQDRLAVLTNLTEGLKNANFKQALAYGEEAKTLISR